MKAASNQIGKNNISFIIRQHFQIEIEFKPWIINLSKITFLHADNGAIPTT